MTGEDKRKVAVAEALSAIADLPRAELINRWEAAHRRPPPKGISRRLLEYSAAYGIQAEAFGGLKPSSRRRLERVPGRKHATASERVSAKPSLSVGARLVRDWHGQTHTVDVTEGGFRYDGRDYNSLTQIAREITGTRWSGPRFFGL